MCCQKGERERIDRQPRATSADPGTTCLAIKKHTVPGIADAASRGRQPSIVDSHCGGVAVQSSGRAGVAGIREPIEDSLCANYDATPELVVDPELAAAQELAVTCRRVGAPEA